MVEIFKTSVADKVYADLLISYIHRSFPDYCANFDLTDFDRILRVAASGKIEVIAICKIVGYLGYTAELLGDPKQNVAR